MSREAPGPPPVGAAAAGTVDRKPRDVAEQQAFRQQAIRCCGANVPQSCDGRKWCCR